MTKQFEGQMTLEELFGVSMSAPSPSKPAKPPKEDTGTATKTRRRRTRKTAEKTTKDSPVTPRQRKSSVAIHAATPDPDRINEETAKLLDIIIEAAKKKTLYPGDKTRIETAVLKDSGSMSTYILVVNAMSDIAGETWTECHDGSAVKFTKGYVTIRDVNGKTGHVAWAPVYEALCDVIKEKKWLTPKERKRDREEGEGAKGRKRGW